MQEHSDVAEPAQVPRNFLGEPQDDSSQQKDDRAVEKAPEESFLSRVVAPRRRHFVVFILDVMSQRAPPLFVYGACFHLRRPKLIHPHHGKKENQPYPWMQHSGNLSAAKNGSDPQAP